MYQVPGKQSGLLAKSVVKHGMNKVADFHTCAKIKMAGNGWKWLEMARKITGIFRKWLEMALMARSGLNWREHLEMAINGWEKRENLEITGKC